jgi:hypothetical protein
VLHAAGALEPSLADYNVVLRLERGNVDALYNRGTVYEKLGQLDDAIFDFTAVLELDPNHIKASYARGACRNLKGEYHKAIGALAAQQAGGRGPAGGRRRRRPRLGAPRPGGSLAGCQTCRGRQLGQHPAPLRPLPSLPSPP